MSLSKQEFLHILLDIAAEECLVVRPTLSPGTGAESPQMSARSPQTARSFISSSLRRGAIIKRKTSKNQSLKEFVHTISEDEKEKRLKLLANFLKDDWLQFGIVKLSKDIIRTVLERDFQRRNAMITKIREVFPELICIKVTSL